MNKLTEVQYTGKDGAVMGLDEQGVWQTYTSGQIYNDIISGKYGEPAPWFPSEEVEVPTVIIIPAVTFWERTTEAEGTAIETMLNQQPFRVRQIFMTAQSYRSDHELWPLLQSAAIGLFGETRAAELLASP